VGAWLAWQHPPDGLVVEAARRLRDPRRRVDALADELGVSDRQLRRRFDSGVGYGPKTLQRVLRFRGFLRRAERDGGDLAELAFESGYADQAHLTRDCARLAGLPPAALLRVRRQPLAVAAGYAASEWPWVAAAR
jgi:AraC-like DNA-binding protein